MTIHRRCEARHSAHACCRWTACALLLAVGWPALAASLALAWRGRRCGGA